MNRPIDGVPSARQPTDIVRDALLQRAERLDEIGRALVAAKDTDAMFAVVADRAVTAVPGAEQAGITVLRGNRLSTVAVRGTDVRTVDTLQYELRTGPCLAALVLERHVRVDDLATDPRWPGFAAQAVARTAVRSVLAYRLFVESDPTVTAALNMYAARPGAFDDDSHEAGLLLATHAAHAVESVAARQKAANLQVALANSQVIGAAIGVVMGLHGVTREQAFDLLRLASQHHHRKLADIATDVVETGALPESTRPA